MSIMTRHARKSSRPATIRSTPTTFGVGIFEPVAGVETLDDWGARFDAAQARYRKPAAVEVATSVVNLDDADPYRNGWTPELATARLDAITARMDANIAVIDGQIEACEACESDDVEAEPADWPAWTDESVWTTTNAPSFADELVEAFRSPRRGPIVEPVDSAWYNGFTLGASGYEVHQVAPPSHYTPAERAAFVDGLASGSAERWADYERHMDRMEALEMMDRMHDIADMEARMVSC